MESTITSERGSCTVILFYPAGSFGDSSVGIPSRTRGLCSGNRVCVTRILMLGDGLRDITDPKLYE